METPSASLLLESGIGVLVAAPGHAGDQEDLFAMLSRAEAAGSGHRAKRTRRTKVEIELGKDLEEDGCDDLLALLAVSADSDGGATSAGALSTLSAPDWAERLMLFDGDTRILSSLQSSALRTLRAARRKVFADEQLECDRWSQFALEDAPIVGSAKSMGASVDKCKKGFQKDTRLTAWCEVTSKVVLIVLWFLSVSSMLTGGVGPPPAYEGIALFKGMLSDETPMELRMNMFEGSTFEDVMRAFGASPVPSSAETEQPTGFQKGIAKVMQTSLFLGVLLRQIDTGTFHFSS